MTSKWTGCNHNILLLSYRRFISYGIQQVQQEAHHYLMPGRQLILRLEDGHPSVLFHWANDECSFIEVATHIHHLSRKSCGHSWRSHVTKLIPIFQKQSIILGVPYWEHDLRHNKALCAEWFIKRMLRIDVMADVVCIVSVPPWRDTLSPVWDETIFFGCASS